MGSLSRGMIPLHFLKSELPPSEWQHAFRRDFVEELQNVGGFTLVYGDLSSVQGRVANEGLHIMSNRGEDGKVLAQESGECTFGVSNSLYTQPWPKVQLAEQMLHKVINTDESFKLSLDLLVECGFGILSHNTFGNTTSQDGAGKLRETIFVPPLESAPQANANQTCILSGFYGTRTQTVIVADESGNFRYIERDTHKLDTVEGRDEVASKHFSFRIGSGSVVAHPVIT